MKSVFLALLMVGCASASGPEPADGGTDVGDDAGVATDSGPDVVVLCDAEVDTCGFEDRALCPAAPPELRTSCADDLLGCAYCDPGDLRTAVTAFTCDLNRWSYDYQTCIP